MNELMLLEDKEEFQFDRDWADDNDMHAYYAANHEKVDKLYDATFQHIIENIQGDTVTAHKMTRQSIQDYMSKRIMEASSEQIHKKRKLLEEKRNASKVFIHIPKNAGMSIRRDPWLKNNIIEAGPNLHVSPEYTKAVKDKMDSLGDHHGYEHARARDLNADVWNERYGFAVVRNPWERTVSRYLFAKKVIEVEKKVPADYADVSSFQAFLEERYKWADEEYMWHRAVRGWYNQKEYVTEADSNELMVNVVRFEHLDEDLKLVFPNMDKGHKLAPRNVTGLEEDSYLNYYNSTSAEIVETFYRDDIEFFGFDFDSPATKNWVGV